MEKENSSASRNSLVSSKHGIQRSKLSKGTVPLGKLGVFCLNISFLLKKSAVDFYLDLFNHLFVCLFICSILFY